MRAVVCRDFGESSVEDIPRPTPTDNEVVIRVDRVQLSVTECQMYRGKQLGSIETVQDRMNQGDGRVFGHEFCGVVDETGSNVTSLEIGDRVYAPAKIACHTCAYCDAGYTQLCKNKETIGMDRPGALAEYVALPPDPLESVPSEVSDAEAAALQPLASAALCVHDAGIQTGDVVAVVGCGVMGYQCGQLAKYQGAEEVFVVDVVSQKLEIAESQGLTPIDASTHDPVTFIKEATNGIGADVVFPAVGGEQEHVTSGSPVAQAIEMTRSGGTVLQVGLLIGEMKIEPRQLRSSSIRWINPRFGVTSTGPNTATGELVGSLVARNQISINEYITHELPGLSSFEDAVNITLAKDEHDALGPPQIIVN